MTTGGSTPQRLGRTAALGVSLQLTVRIVGVAATLVAVVASLALVVLVVGLLWFPACARSLRAQVLGIARVQARATGQQLPVPTLPDITPPAPGDSALRTALRDTVALVTNRATWRLLLWALLESCLGVVLAVLPIGLVGWGIDGLLVMPLLHLVLRLEPNEWYAFVPVSSPSMVPVASLLGLVFIALGWLTGPWWVRLHGRWCTVLLAPGEEELRARVEELTVSRTEIRDDAAAELRRLEREVHDGTQSQLVAIGLTLGTAEAMLETDPDRARELIEQAREQSSLALSDLRGLMRGIRPPILADRGLGAALEALALDATTAVSVHTELTSPLDPALETAAYFAARELVTNAIKHAGASRIAVDARTERSRLVVTVTDDGAGGAVPVPGRGLDGVQRRLAPFDGSLSVTSPPGGPTVMRIEAPCES